MNVEIVEGDVGFAEPSIYLVGIGHVLRHAPIGNGNRVHGIYLFGF